MSTNTLGKYQIVREIARSNDIVYEGLDPTLNRRVALKELAIPPNLSPNDREDRRNRFRREAEAAGRLSHPNIISIFDYGTDRDRCYIAMEFLEGQDLRDVIKLRGALPIDEAIRISLEILDALAYAHANSVVHRDIKPDNVHVLPGGHIKLTDFGIARLMDEPTITADGQVFGTPSYMSPEQVAGKQIDHRSDIFSMGVVLYELLTGRKPFSGDSVVTITYNILNREPTPPPGVPPHLTAIIRKAMAKDAAMRYQSAEEMAQDLLNRKAPNGFSDPFTGAGGFQSDPFGPPQAGSGTVSTPTPANYQGSGTPSPTVAPDPFLKAPSPHLPPAPPREPILSPEARNFLGILLVVVGLTGMLLFTIWAVNEAYQSYASGISEDRAVAYYDQGVKLLNDGEFRGAISQFENAVRVAPRSKTAKIARENLVAGYVALGQAALKTNDSEVALSYANQALAAKADSAAAHLLAGEAHSRLGRLDKAMEEWDAAERAEPSSNEAALARENIGGVYYAQAEHLWRAGRTHEAGEMYGRVIQEVPGTNAASAAQQRLDEIQGLRPAQ